MKVILIAAQKGGSGKSTLAAHFGVLADRPGKPAVLIDADPQGSLTYWHSRREADTPVLIRAQGQDIAGVLSDAAESEIDYVLIDSPPSNSGVVAQLMRRVDLVLVPTRAGVFDIVASAATFDLARELEVPFV